MDSKDILAKHGLDAINASKTNAKKVEEFCGEICSLKDALSSTYASHPMVEDEKVSIALHSTYASCLVVEDEKVVIAAKWESESK